MTQSIQPELIEQTVQEDEDASRRLDWPAAPPVITAWRDQLMLEKAAG
jgi:hypothetical protein